MNKSDIITIHATVPSESYRTSGWIDLASLTTIVPTYKNKRTLVELIPEIETLPNVDRL